MTHKILFILFSGMFIACGSSTEGSTDGADSTAVQDVVADTLVTPAVQETKYDDCLKFGEDGMPQKIVYKEAGSKGNCFLVISKVHQEHMSVYESVNKDTVLLATYPVCLSRCKGQKERKGDNKTPESYPGKAFRITQIQDAHDWKHDFNDGRGEVLAYGAWFMRLETPGHSGIGIHGSTNNRESIKVGRGSEGCIRLLDEDIKHLHDHYAIVGTPVIILPENHGPLNFEIKAYRKVGLNINPNGTVAPRKTEVKSEAKVEVKSDAQHNVKTETPSEAKQEVKNSGKKTVKVKGTRQQLRVGPGPDYEFYKNGEISICPEDGEQLEVKGESGNYYKVIFQGKDLYINKLSCEE